MPEWTIRVMTAVRVEAATLDEAKRAVMHARVTVQTVEPYGTILRTDSQLVPERPEPAAKSHGMGGTR